MNCDFLVASERAKFGDTHTRVGVHPAWGLSVLLPAAVGVRRAREMSFTGNFISAEQALAWGLVNHVVAHDELLPTARRLALDIVGNDQAGVRNLRATYDLIHGDTDGLGHRGRARRGMAGRALRSRRGRGAPARPRRTRQPPVAPPHGATTSVQIDGAALAEVGLDGLGDVEGEDLGAGHVEVEAVALRARA